MISFNPVYILLLSKSIPFLQLIFFERFLVLTLFDNFLPNIFLQLCIYTSFWYFLAICILTLLKTSWYLLKNLQHEWMFWCQKPFKFWLSKRDRCFSSTIWQKKCIINQEVVLSLLFTLLTLSQGANGMKMVGLNTSVLELQQRLFEDFGGGLLTLDPGFCSYFRGKQQANLQGVV